MIRAEIKFSFFTRMVMVVTKLALILVMLFSVVALFFVGSGIVKPQEPMSIITKEVSIK